MRKINTFIVLLLCVMVVNTYAQVELKLNSSKNEFSVLEKSPYKIKIKTSVDKMKTLNISTVSGNFIELGITGFSKIYDAGKPQLPVLNKLIEIPYNAEIQVNIISYNEQIINLTDVGIMRKIMPSQPSVSKSATEIPFYYDKAFYQTNAFNNPEMVTVTTSGIMRGVQIGNMTISPLRYNPVTNTLKIYNDLVFEIIFKHPDIALTEEMKAKYYSPAFESSLSTLINHTQPMAKDVITKYPIKYVIISLTSFQATLQPFAYWKRQKGFTVIEQYYSSLPTAATVKAYLQGLYNAATVLNPAPTFVLFVGDVAQIPTYTGIADAAHKTDLYFCTLDVSNDYLPDMYYGRFSATSVAQLQPQIDKTLEYEKYLMPNPSYLDTVVMIAGVDDGSQPDGGYSQVYGNGQINYGTNNYFNSSHGMYSYTYLWPVTNNSATDVLIRNEIGTGVGYANYTAHGSSTGWADPSFQTSNIAAMHNNHKYCLMVGNCCQTNTFNDTECFGEALLRAANKGAVGYIGASDYSYWDEDYYFGVGSRASIVENPTYSAANLGAYDRMFHDHAEPKTSWYYTNDQMIYAGNLAVEQSVSTMKQYYWEIYHLMGDPSVMTYFSVPDPLTVAYTSPQNVGITSLVVNTIEDAYVAISHSGVLLDAELAPVGGVVTLNFTAINSPDTLDVVVTKQNKQPYIGTLRIVAPSIPLDAEMVSIISPEASYSCTGINIVPQVSVRNAGTTTFTSLRITYQVSGSSPQIYNWAGTLTSGQSTTITLPQITLTTGNFTFTATSSLPNGLADQNTANDSKIKNFSVADLPISSDFSADIRESCGAPLSAQFTNNSTNSSSYLWDFGDGSTSTDATPTHNYTALGTYTVVLTAYAGVCGNDVETKPAYITVGADAPVAIDESRCGQGSVTLNVTGAGTLNWYDADIAGNLLTTGTSYVTPSLSATTSYYVESIIDGGTAYGGKTNSSTTGNYYTSTASQGLIFDAFQPFVLKSAKVYSNTSSTNRIFSLYNSSDQFLNSVTVTVPNGESRITLNLSIPIGTGMKIKAPANCRLWRDGSMTISYPFTVANVFSIIMSTAGSPNDYNYYYYLYDWEVEMPDCKSARTEVTATILSVAPVAQFTASPTDPTVNFTNTSTNGVSYFWDFDDGVTNTTTNPSHTYLANGTYNVMLITTNNCTSDTTYQEVIILTTGIQENTTANIEVFPNPTNGIINVKLNGITVKKMALTDILGKELYTAANISGQIKLDLSTYQIGVYFLRFYSADKVFTYRITRID